MNQRLFFLFPDREHALTAVKELVADGIDRRHIHTLAGNGVSLRGLPESNPNQRNDLAGRIEFWGWRSNLALFFAAATTLVFLIALQAGLWLLLPAAIMVFTFVMGMRFARLPNTHIDEFREALSHGEILLMIDTSTQRTGEPEFRLKHHHPEAIAGGSSWNIPILGT